MMMFDAVLSNCKSSSIVTKELDERFQSAN